MRVLSPAKLNLGLWLLGKRSDGYHEIFTIYHAIDLFDEILIEDGPLSIETSTGIPMEENLVYKAIKLMENRLGEEINFRIFIQKMANATNCDLHWLITGKGKPFREDPNCTCRHTRA